MGSRPEGPLRVSGFRQNGQILPWRDALYAGPVPKNLPLGELSRLRSKFWTNGRRVTEFDKRDAVLTSHADYNEIVLWFGSQCTLCALSLVQLLSWFRENCSGPLISGRNPCRNSETEQLRLVYTKRQPVSSAQMIIANRVWHAFRSSSPAGLSRLLPSKLDVLPGMRRAVLWLPREYPGGANRLHMA
jgi:hypothetical protein